MDLVIKQFEVYLINLDPTLGSEIRKTRPCLVVSPDEMNKYLNTVIIIPLTSAIKNYPTRIHCTFDNRKGQLALDQIRAVDKIRLFMLMGNFAHTPTLKKVSDLLMEMFSFTGL